MTPRGASGTPPPTMFRKASPCRKRARRPGGAGRPTSHFSTVRRAGCPHPAAASPLPPVFGLFRTKKQGFARSRSPAVPLTAMLLFPRQQHRQHSLFHVDAVLRLVENFVGVGFQHIGGDLLAAVGGCGWSFWRKPAPPPCPADPSGPRRPCAAACTRRPHPECAEFPRASCRPASADVSYAFLQYAAQNRQRGVHVVRRQDQRR